MAMDNKAFPVTLLDTGDSTFILAELVKQKADGWVIPIFDPKAVQQALSAGIGQLFAFPVGGKTDTMHGEPVMIRAR